MFIPREREIWMLEEGRKAYIIWAAEAQQSERIHVS